MHPESSEPSTAWRLPYTPPFDWNGLLSVFRAHQLPHLESVDDVGYERVVKTTRGTGWFRVVHDAKRNSVRVTAWNAGDADIARIGNAVRRMFDLGADPDVIAKSMSGDPYLSAIWKGNPGLRVARSWSGFESILTTILGQLVSVRFGRTLIDELMKASGAKTRHPKTGDSIHLFPTAKRLLTADLTSLRTSEARRKAIRGVAQLVDEGGLAWEQSMPPKELRKALLSIPGIGAWTSEYVAMRGFQDDDAFPATDYGLKQELKRHPEVDVNRVRPWRAYAATALWKGFAEAKNTAYESVI